MLGAARACSFHRVRLRKRRTKLSAKDVVSWLGSENDQGLMGKKQPGWARRLETKERGQSGNNVMFCQRAGRSKVREIICFLARRGVGQAADRGRGG